VHLGGEVRRVSQRKAAVRPRERRVPKQHLQQLVLRSCAMHACMHVTGEEEEEEAAETRKRGLVFLGMGVRY